jgi:hypothetical protein
MSLPPDLNRHLNPRERVRQRSGKALGSFGLRVLCSAQKPRPGLRKSGGWPLYATEEVGEGKSVVPESSPSGEAGKSSLLILVNLEDGQELGDHQKVPDLLGQVQEFKLLSLSGDGSVRSHQFTYA